MGSRLEAVASEVRAGHDEAARAILGAESTVPDDARYLLGRLVERTGEPVLALAQYQAVDASALPPPVRDDLHLRIARLLLASGAPDHAETALALVAAPTRVSRALAAEAAAARGEHALAERRLRAAIAEEGDDTDGFALRMSLAEVLAAQDRGEQAIETLRALVVARPEHPDDASAWAAAQSIGGSEMLLTTAERLTRIEHLSERHMHARAIDECTLVTIPEAGTERANALHVLGMAHYRARREEEAHELLAEAARLGGPHEEEDAFHAARAIHRRHADRAGMRALRAFARAHARHRLAIEAEYLAASTELDLDPARGRRSLARFVTAHPSGDYGREASFRLAMDAFDRHRWDDAERRLESLSTTDDGLERLRIRYWRARVQDERGRWAPAAAGYRALIEASPLHYYALLSRQRLVAHGDPDPAPFDDAAPTPVPEASIAWPAAAAFYRSLGLDADAARVLRGDERRLRAEHGLRALVEAYVSLGAWERAYRLVVQSELLEAPWSDETAWAWRAAYPAAFEPEVRAAASESHIEAELLWAVMRQESAYAPGVVSVSDAIGLMQLLPSTASRVAGDLGVPFRRELLFTPGFNVRFGARYLSELVALVGVPAAFAAYNAGEHRVAQWWAAPACRGEWALDRFVDWIPFSQTRGYVRRVTSHWLRYRYLRAVSGAAPTATTSWPDVALPDTAGDGRACDRAE